MSLLTKADAEALAAKIRDDAQNDAESVTQRILAAGEDAAVRILAVADALANAEISKLAQESAYFTVLEGSTENWTRDATATQITVRLRTDKGTFEPIDGPVRFKVPLKYRIIVAVVEVKS